MLSFLIFIITVFAILLFEVEQGKGCYVGESDCEVPESVVDIVSKGQFIFINKQGELSQFPNALYGLWFSIVTMTSTGYGEIVPSTNAGLMMAVFLMLFGAMYMAMPLTAAASVFFVIHETYNEKKKKKKSVENRSGSTDFLNRKGPERKQGSIIHKVSLNSVLNTKMKQNDVKDVHSVPIKFILSADFDIQTKVHMELAVSKAEELSSKIELLLKDIQVPPDSGPIVSVVDQTANIIKEFSSFTTLFTAENASTLDKLSDQFYSMKLEKGV